MLDSARRQAEDAILDQRVFFLAPDAHEAFLAMLDLPAKPIKELQSLLKRKPVWEH